MSVIAVSVAPAEAQALRILAQSPNPVMQLTATADLLYANTAAHTLLQHLFSTQATCPYQHLLAVAQRCPSEQEISLAGYHYLLTVVAAAEHYTLYLTDISARHRSEQQQIRQRDFFETVLHHMPTGVTVFDLEHRLQYANPSAIRNTRIREGAIGKTNFEYCAEFNHSLALAVRRQEKFELAVSTGQEVLWEETFTGSTGPRQWMRLLRPIIGPTGSVCLLVGSSTEVTERYLAEQAIEQARREAEAAVRVQETFLANMSHEIRTPMNGVLGMAGLLGRTELSAQQREYVSIIRHSGNHLLGVLNDVLDMAKITAGKLDLEHTPFDLLETLRTASQIQAFRATEKRIGFELLLPEHPLPLVLGDAHRLSQVLLNLLCNAIKFTAQGQVALRCQLRTESDTTLTVSFQVSDTGLGVAADKQAVIFESFAQAYTDTTRHFGGTGLGLAISSQLVAQLGGHLVLCSQLGKGSTFSFTLPLTKAPPETRLASGVASETAAKLMQGWRVLLVEDHDVNRQLAQLVLEQHAMVVDAAANGTAALALFQGNRYDVILMDIQMPDMSGLDVTAIMRRHSDPARAQTPIIALTANAFRTDNERYLAAGMNDCLAKPFDEADLLRKMQAVRKAPPVAVAPLFDLSNLYQVAHGSTAFVRRILDSFLSSTPLLITQLQHALEATNWVVAAGCAHKLKPTLKLLQVAGLTEASQTLEDTTAPLTARLAAAQLLLTTLPVLLTQLSQRAEEMPPA